MAFGLGSRRRSGAGLLGGLSGVAVGAGMMWLLDPRRGTARRSGLGQRAGRAFREAEGLVEAGTRDLRHRASGLAAEAKARLRPEAADDDVVAERVRSRLGRLTSHSRAIEVAVRKAKVELSGRVLEADAAAVLAGVRAVRGVHGVEDRLERHATAEGVRELQGGGHAAGPRPELLQEHWSPGARLLGALTGSMLLGRALFGSGVLRPLYGVAGGGLLARSLANAPVREVALRAGHRAAGEAKEKLERARAKVEEVKSPAEGPAQDREREAERGEEPPEGGWKMSGAVEPGAVVEPFGAEAGVHSEPPVGPPGRDVSAPGPGAGEAWNEPAFPTSPEPGTAAPEGAAGARREPAGDRGPARREAKEPGARPAEQGDPTKEDP